MNKWLLSIPVVLGTMFCIGALAPHPALAAGKERGLARVAKPATVPKFGHVFLLIGENTSAQDVNAKNTPYIVNTLMPAGGTLTNYYALHGGSLSDYIGLTAGHFSQCEVNDAFPYNRATGKPSCIDKGPSVFHLLDKAGISWTDWNESMPNPCGFFDMGTDYAYNIYATHHNPAVYFTDVEGEVYSEAFHRVPNAECMSNVLPMGTTAPNDTTAFDNALATGTVPAFNFVTPNECEDGHDVCSDTGRLGQFDAFLAREVPKIMASPAFGTDGLIIVTYDEWGDNTPHDHRVAFVAIGPQVTPGSTNGAAYSHYGLLRTIEDGYGLRPYLGGAAQAKSIAGIWATSRR